MFSSGLRFLSMRVLRVDEGIKRHPRSVSALWWDYIRTEPFRIGRKRDVLVEHKVASSRDEKATRDENRSGRVG